MLECDWTWWGLLTNQNHAQEVSRGVQRGVWRYAEGCVEVCRGMQRYTEVCRGTQRGAWRYTEVCGCV